MLRPRLHTLSFCLQLVCMPSHSFGCAFLPLPAVCLLLQTGVTLMMSHLHEELAQVLARLRGVPDIQQAAEQLRQEPMFCIETGGCDACSRECLAVHFLLLKSGGRGGGDCQQREPRRLEADHSFIHAASHAAVDQPTR